MPVQPLHAGKPLPLGKPTPPRASYNLNPFDAGATRDLSKPKPLPPADERAGDAKGP